MLLRKRGGHFCQEIYGTFLLAWCGFVRQRLKEIWTGELLQTVGVILSGLATVTRLGGLDSYQVEYLAFVRLTMR